MSLTKPPQSSPLAGGRGLKLLLVAAALLVVGGGAGFALMPSSGTLVVSASGPHGRILPSVEIFVDEVKRCNESPCRVDGLSDGVHIVAAKAPGYDTMAGKAVKVQSGDEVPFDLELQASTTTEKTLAQTEKLEKKPEEKDAPEKDSDEETAPTTSIEDLEPVNRGAPAAAPAAARGPASPAGNTALAQQLAGVAPSQPQAASQPAAPKGTQSKLNINSIPATSVVVDGMPLGRTPKVGLTVAPGSHTIVFIHPEHGRKVRQLTVQPGQTQTAAVRFP